MNIEKYNYEEKKQRHVDIKKEIDARIGPGAYINPKVHSEFKPEGKPEYLQFFGSTEERFKTFLGGLPSSTTAITGLAGNELVPNKPGDVPTLPGPGAYDPEKDVKGGHNTLRKVATAAFASQRKDQLFSGNDVPGPGQYSTTNKGGQQGLKNWQTNIGAFGTTEKRFISNHTSTTTAATNTQ